MNNKILNAIKNDYRLSKDYLNGYMSTIECGKQDAVSSENIKLNTAELLRKSDEIFASTHSAQNAIYSKEFDKQLAKGSKAYNRARESKKARQIVNESLSEEELDNLTF